MPDTRFRVPTTVDEVVHHLGEREDTVLVAGGTSVVILLKQALIDPANIVYLGKVDGLDAVSVADERISIGATATLHDLARSPIVANNWPMLTSAAAKVGNPRVRAVATAGGALVHADPRQDLLPPLLAAGATARVQGPGGSTEIDIASDFFTGFMSTALAPDELVVSIELPTPGDRKSAYVRFTPNSGEDYPTVAVAASTGVSDGKVTTLRVALGGVADTPILIGGLEDLAGHEPGLALFDEVAERAAASSQPIDDRHGSAAYKRAMTRVWTTRVLSGLLGGSDEHWDPPTRAGPYTSNSEQIVSNEEEEER